MGLKHYDKAFKGRAVKLSYEIVNISTTSRKLGISDSILGQRRKLLKSLEIKVFQVRKINA